MVTVEVEEAPSETTVKPLESLVTEAEVAFAVSGVVSGRLLNAALLYHHCQQQDIENAKKVKNMMRPTSTSRT